MRKFAVVCGIGLMALIAAASYARSEKVEKLALEDSTGKKHSLSELKDSKLAVFFFTSVDCPAANRYVRRVVKLHKDYEAKGVKFFAVYSHAFDTRSDIQVHAREAGLSFPALLDSDQRLAETLEVRVTPTAVVVGAGGLVCYRGAIDDNNKVAELAKKHYVRDAIDAVLSGKKVAIESTEPVGCLIQRRLKESADAEVTYSSHIGAILHKNCATCHRPGQVAPFSLLTYEQARRWADNIKSYTQARAMPPWKPANHGMFKGERWMAPSDIELISKWVDAGAPLGDPAKVPAPPKFSDDWVLGKPDLVLAAEEYDVEATGPDEYRSFVLDPKLTEDRYVQAVEYRPGNSRIVHHVITYIDTLGASLKLDANDPKPGYSTRGTGPGFLPLGDIGGWGPGMQPSPLPEGTALFLPKGAKLVMEVHYHKNGRAEKDRTTVGLYFAKGPVKKRVRSHVVLNMRFKLPPGDKRHEVKASWNVPEHMHAIAIIPHMHMIGREILVTATLPEKTETTLVHVKDWDFNWQEIYYFAKPFALPKGTKINLTCWFDNSADNPNNPNNPPKPIRFGEQTTDEMAVAYIAYTKDDEQLTVMSKK